MKLENQALDEITGQILAVKNFLGDDRRTEEKNMLLT